MLIDGAVEPLRSILAEPLGRESELIDLLVKVRKVIELKPGRYPVLTFFCDWPLHVKLDRKSARSVLDKFDAFVGEYRQRGSATGEMWERTKPLTSFSRLRSELVQILREHGLDARQIEGFEGWVRFLKLYVRAVSATPLVTRPDWGLSHLRTINVSGMPVPFGPLADPTDVFRFRTVWHLWGDGGDYYAIHNDLSLSQPPVHFSVPLFKLTNEGGVITRAEIESKEF
jgi:hypothetical protein